MPQNLQILMVSEGFAPDEMAGAGRWLFEVARRLVRMGHAVTVVVRRCHPDLPAVQEIEGLHVLRFGTSQFNASLWKGLGDIRHGRAVMRSAGGRYDLLHIFQPFSGLIARTTFPALPRVYTYFSPWHEEYLVNCRRSRPGLRPGYWVRYWVESQVLRACRRIITLSDYSRGQVERYHGYADRCRKIPGGVDLDRFTLPVSKTSARAALGIAPETFLAFSLRNLRQRMGLQNLLEAVGILQDKMPGLRLLIGGRGPLGPVLEQTIVSRGLQSRVTLLGEVPEEQLPLYYQAADLFVLPTEKLEGFGLITLEAMASGTPVVATPVGSNVELVSGFDPDLLSSSPAPASLAEAIQSFLKNRNQAQYAPQKLREYAARFSWDSIARQVAGCYQEILPPSTKS